MARFDSFISIHRHLLQFPVPLLPPPKAIDPSLSSEISSLQLHPALEAALHILNLDLPSAHFLVRHMQSPPAYEGMYLHGILHRIEGDYNNARMWYSDVQESELYQQAWGKEGATYKDIQDDESSEYAFSGRKEKELDAGQQFLNSIQRYKDSKTREGNGTMLQVQSRNELDHVIEWCVNKFGTKRMEDASSAWVKHSEEVRRLGEDQVSGAAGPRTF